VTAVSVLELQRAWAAVVAGEFRTGPATHRGARATPQWDPGEPVVVVAGASGRVGATTVAVAAATAADRPVRVVECGPVHATGLAAATTAELGVDDAGWRRGTRDQVLIERTTASFDDPALVPVPGPAACELTVLDAGWDLTRLVGADGWLPAAVATRPLVLVSVATAPGLRALDTALRLTDRPTASWGVLVGPRRSRWRRPPVVAPTPAVDAIAERGRLLRVPVVPAIGLHGLTPDPLPPRLVSACRPILDQTLDHLTGDDHHAVAES
jgi:hypothetical protein